MMLTGINNNQVKFGVTSAELNKPLFLSANTSVEQSPTQSIQATQSIQKDEFKSSVPKKNSHKALKAVGIIIIVAAATFLARTGKLGKTIKNLVTRTAK